MTPTLELKRIRIPLRASFRHAAAERAETESVLVEAHSRGGAVGHGEGCPRRYVTGEDLSSVRAFFLEHRAVLCEEIAAIRDLIAWEAAHRRQIDRNPSAWCAIELAWLDALARERGASVEALLGLPELRGAFRYSAVIGVEPDDVFAAVVQRYSAAGFTDFKVKLSGELRRDRAHLAYLSRHAPAGWRLRLDANNLWDDRLHAARYLESLECPFFAIEEPLRPANRYAALADVAAALRTRVILDESCLRAKQLDHLAPAEQCAAHGSDAGPTPPWIINVRVSKMGGILRSLRVVDGARRRGIPIVVGAQVGETSILTRAALTVANQAADILAAQEGAFGTLLLAADVCEPELVFGRGGILEPSALPAPGFGLAVGADLPFLAPL